MKNNNKKGIIIGAIALIALIAVFAAVYFINKPVTSKGAKNITVEVKTSTGDVTDYELSTDAEYLKDAMDELSSNGSGFSYSGADSEYGIMTRVGLHCAPNAHKTLGTFPTGTVRFSFGWANTKDEVMAALAALAAVLGSH